MVVLAYESGVDFPAGLVAALRPCGHGVRGFAAESRIFESAVESPIVAARFRP